jgi:CDP-6-deoxy-D-xylo-4-hexulose-3-dehydrase
MFGMLKQIAGLRIPYALAVYDNHEINRVVSVLKEHREAMGKETAEFEKNVAKAFGKRYGIMVNSGSSANLLALELLDLPKGSEVITPVLSFSTTVSPIIKMGLTPIFVDTESGKYTIDVNLLEKAITKKTKAIFFPHLVGNVPDMKRILKIAKKYKLFVIEDSCDTFGAKYDKKPTGYYSDITTTSFYGSHLITAGGNGGMIMVNKPEWQRKLKMLRGWGRSSSIFNESEDITKRFSKKIRNTAYDAKFIFAEIGYNFLPNEMGAAFGNEQLKKFPKFSKTRKYNFKRLLKFFKQYESLFILPKQDPKTDTSWLAFPLVIKENSPFTREKLVRYLETNNVQTRPVLTGNILEQPGFVSLRKKWNPQKFPIANEVMERGFLIGCHHGMEEKHLKRLEELFTTFLKPYLNN